MTDNQGRPTLDDLREENDPGILAREALEEAVRLAGELDGKRYGWMLCRGRTRRRTEPLWGFAIHQLNDGLSEGMPEDPIALTEHNNPQECVRLAILELKVWEARFPPSA